MGVIFKDININVMFDLIFCCVVLQRFACVSVSCHPLEMYHYHCVHLIQLAQSTAAE
jgi:hypothetical protein